MVCATLGLPASTAAVSPARSRRVELTAAGSALLGHARRALTEVDAAVDDARHAAEPRHPDYRLWAVQPLLVTRIAKEMAAQRLELEVRLDEDVTPELLRRVTARELVAAAVMETPAAARRHGVRVDALSDEPLLAALPASHGYARAHAIPVGAFAGISEIVDHHEEQIRALDEAPVLIGHSFGGRIVELLLDRGLGRAGVAISPAPPKGIPVLPISSLKARLLLSRGIVTLSLEEFTYGFVNMFSAEDAAAAYERYAVPETGRIFYEAGLANFHLNPPTEVLFKNAARAPLLIVGAQEDNTAPASLARKQYETYGRSPATTEYVEFEGRPQLLMAAEGWEEVAASIDSWLDGVLEGVPVPTGGVSA